MTRPVTVIMLARSMRPSALMQQLGIPALCLPIGASKSLLGAWLEAISEIIPAPEVRVVVGSDEEADAVRACIGRPCAGTPREIPVEVMTDPAPVRGTGGVLRDVAADLPSDRLLMVVEGSCVPNGRLSPLLDALETGVDGVVGATTRGEPAGIYLFEHDALSAVPPLGYHDLKEQLLPAVHAQGRTVRLAEVTDRVLRLRDRESYLEAVRAKLAGGGALEQSAPGIDGVRLAGSCLVEASAVIGEGALVHDSVVLAGAVVEGRAVVSRSVVGPGAVVAAERRVVAQIISRLDLVAGDSVRAGSR